jgi:hypothetical protein
LLPFPHQQTIFPNFMQLLDCVPSFIGTKHPLSSAAAEEE